MKVLIVDDDEQCVKDIKYHCEEKGWEYQQTDFEDCYKSIMRMNPDVVVLDWCVDPGDDAGMPIFESIWMNGYRPIVIFSGNIDTMSLGQEYLSSNLVRRIVKGDEQPVIEFLDEYEDYFTVLSEYRVELGKSLIGAFDGLDQIKDNNSGVVDNSVIKYLLSKRTVNYFDLERADVKLPAWGMYLYPPILGNSLSSCDVIRKITKDTDLTKIGDPSEYLLVLTPSCDMYNEGTRNPKVSEILCAKCVDKTVFADGMSKKKIPGILGSGSNKQWVALPEYKNICPAMTVDMKLLSIISLSSVVFDKEERNEEGAEYIRVCSVDSPFREQIRLFVKNSG